MRLQRLGVLAAALAAAGVLTACGSGGESAETSGASTEQTQAEGEGKSASGEKTTINIWSKDRHDAEYVQAKIDDYNKNNTDNIEVVYTLYTDNYKQAIDMAAQNGELPDFLVYQGEAFNKYLPNGQWADIYPMMGEEMKSYFADVVTVLGAFHIVF